MSISVRSNSILPFPNVRKKFNLFQASCSFLKRSQVLRAHSLCLRRKKMARKFLRPWRATYTYKEEASKVVTFINEEVISYLLLSKIKKEHGIRPP